jgi:DNA polymerase III psi subunit
MKNSNSLVLSDYQRAILTEMGISSWQTQNEPNQATMPSLKTSDRPNGDAKSISKEKSLDRLNQLKTQPKPKEVTSAVLLAFLQSDINHPIVADILVALELDEKQKIHITDEQLDVYAGYPLCWVQSKNISLNGNQLTTPNVGELTTAQNKKTLWQHIQTFPVTNV